MEHCEEGINEKRSMKAQIVVVLFEPNPPELELDWQVYC